MKDPVFPQTFINQENGETLFCQDITNVKYKNDVAYVTVTGRHQFESFEIEKNKLSWIFDNVAQKLVPNYYKNDLTDKVNYIINYDILNTDWTIKKWIQFDQEKIIKWYNNLISVYKDWQWSYGKHKDQWLHDPNEQVGQFLKPDTSWIMLTWGDNREGPVPWLRYIAKPEFNTYMPRNINLPEFGLQDHSLGARECFNGYAKELIESIPGGPHDIQVAIHTPGTKLPSHQDLPDKIRFHIPIITNPKAVFTIENNDICIPADGWIYLVNTTKLHATDNKGTQDRIHIYGSVWTHEILNLDLDSLETLL